MRVCDGLSCELAGAQDLLARLPALLGTDVRVIAAPCVGRCEQAPVAVVGQAPVVHAQGERCSASSSISEVNVPPCASDDAGFDAMRRGPGFDLDSQPTACRPATSGYDTYRRSGGYRTRAVDCLGREHHGRRAESHDGLRPAWPRRRRIPGRTQVGHRARAAGAAPDGRQHRRRRARHVQGPHLPRARSASLSRGHADCRDRGRHRRLLHLPARRVSRLPRDPRARTAAAASRPAVRSCRSSNCAAARAPTSAAKSPR